MSPKFIVSAIASSSLLLAVILGTGPNAHGQAAKAKARTKVVAKAKLDINNATAEELEEHLPGVGAVTAKKIVAGRPYSTVDDLAKAGVPARTIEGIRDLVTVTVPHAGAAERGTGKTTAKTASKAATGAAHVNLNTATVEQLETLPGIGPAHAKEIVANRPYKSVDDLERVKGIGKARIDALRPLVTATMPEQPTGTTTAVTTRRVEPAGTKPAAKSVAPAGTKPAAKTARLAPGQRVNINTASKEELDALPGIGPVKAQAILEGRPFKTIEDIMKVKGIKEGEFGKIKDMITVE